MPVDDIKQKYNTLAEKYNQDIKSLHWPSRERQELSFEAFCNHIDLHGHQILDVGCGFGDFYFYLKNKGIETDYHGIDIADRIIEIGKKKNRTISHRLRVSDVLTDNLPPCDYVVISGTFNLKIEDNWSFITKAVKKSFDLCRKGVLFTLISTYVDYREAHLSYMDPAKIFDYCKQITPYVNIINDYNPYEYMVMLLKSEKK